MDGPEQGRDALAARILARRRLIAGTGATAGGLAYLLADASPAGATVAETDLVTLAEAVRGGATMTGGGEIVASQLQGTAPAQHVELSWSAPFTVGHAVSSGFSTEGRFAIAAPPASTVVTGVNRGDVTVTAAGVPIGPDDALYYVLPIGAGSASDPANFRIVQPALAPSPTPFETPAEWVLVAAGIPGTHSVRLGSGVVLEPGGRWEQSWGTVGTGSPELSAGATWLPVTAFGARSGRRVTDAAMTGGSNQLSSASAPFTDADVGSLVAVRGAAPPGTGGGPNADLWSTVTGVAGGVAQLAHSAATSVSGAEAHVGPDCRGAFQDALVAASAVGGGTVAVPPGVYLLSRYVLGQGIDNVRISGAATIRYGSANLATTADATVPSTNQARSAFVFYDARNITIEGLRFVGDYASTSLSENSGSVAYGMTNNVANLGVDFLTLDGVQSWYGYSLLQHDERLAGDGAARGARLVNCTSFGARGYVSLPSHSVVTGCHFELPRDDASYTSAQSPSRGSTHAIYLFAGREAVVVKDNTFRFQRRWALKASGSTIPVRGVVFSGNDVWDCGGGAQFGADDDQLHANFVCTGNSFYNTATRASGWAESATVDVLGVKNAVVAQNVFYFEGPVAQSAGRSVISITAAGPASAPVEQVLVEGNLIQGLVTADPGANPAFGRAIRLAHVGEHAKDPAEGGTTGDPGPSALCVRVAGNQVKGCAGIAITAERTLNPIIEHNQVSNVTLFAQLDGCAFPVLRGNVLLPGAAHTTYAQIRIQDCAWPIVYDNHSGGIRSLPDGKFTSRSRHMSTTDNGAGRDAVEFPLLGRKGKAVPTQGRSEVVLAYGSSAAWQAGDAVTVGGATFVHGTHFTDVGTLTAAIDALPGFDAADYGKPTWDVETRHIRIRGGAGSFVVTVVAAAATVGRLLSNADIEGHNPRTNAVGGTPGATVIWSPMAEMTCTPVLVATNQAARGLLAGGYLVADRTPGMDGAYALAVHDTPEGDEEFRWAVH